MPAWSLISPVFISTSPSIAISTANSFFLRWSLIYRSILGCEISCFRTRTAEAFPILLRLSNFLVIARHSSFLIFLFKFHFLNRSLYCLSLCPCQLGIVILKSTDSYDAVRPWFCFMNAWISGSFFFSTSCSLVISSLCSSQSAAAYFRSCGAGGRVGGSMGYGSICCWSCAYGEAGIAYCWY